MSEVPLTPEQEQHAEIQSQHHSYVVRVLKGVDELANVVADGNLDETISARVGRLADHNELARLILMGLDELQPQHGEKAEAGNLADAKHVEQVEEQGLAASIPAADLAPAQEQPYLHGMEDAVEGSTETPASEVPASDLSKQ